MAVPPSVIAQQYSSAILVSLRFHSRKEKFRARVKSIIYTSFRVLKLHKSEIM
jgi:hypothetical protein